MEILELFEKLLKIKMIGSTAEWRGREMTINLKTEQHKLLNPKKRGGKLKMTEE